MKQIIRFAVLITVIGATGCKDVPSGSTSTPQIPAQLLTVATQATQGTTNVSGVLKAREEADISAQILAPVEIVTKHEGDRVRRGDILIQLRAPALRAGVGQASAALESARLQSQAASAGAALAAVNLARYAQLRERHSVTPYELDQYREQSEAAAAEAQRSKAEMDAAKSALQAQQANAADAILYAPFDGVVAKRLVDPGAMATPGAPLLYLQSTGALDVVFAVPVSSADSVRVGTSVSISNGTGAGMQARVTSIDPGGDAGSHSFMVKAVLPEASTLRAGTVVQVAVPSSRTTDQILLPETAIVHQGGLDAVIVVDATGMASVRYVTLGTVQGAMTEILTGVHAGERIVRNGDINLAGKRIEVRQ
jgi:RND family efflux transporter MFP subunit